MSKVSHIIAEHIAGLVQQGLTAKEIALKLDLTVCTVYQRIRKARALLGEETVPFHQGPKKGPPRRKRPKGMAFVVRKKDAWVQWSDETLQQVGALWRQGLSGPAIVDILKLHADPATLITLARRKLGHNAMPVRAGNPHCPKVGSIKQAPITMLDMGKRFMRGAGVAGEFVFRNEDGSEEVWKVASPSDTGALVWTHGRRKDRVVFKEALLARQ